MSRTGADGIGALVRGHMTSSYLDALVSKMGAIGHFCPPLSTGAPRLPPRSHPQQPTLAHAIGWAIF